MKIFRARRLHAVSVLTLIGMLPLTGVSATQVIGNAGGRQSVTSTAPSGESEPKPTVVLVHGAWADSSGWAKVTSDLQAQGYQVLAPPTPLRGLREDSEYLAAFLRDRTTGPVVLVGHSYGGAVITNAARSDKDVEALVYINAFVPDAGDSILGLLDPNHELDPADLFDFVQYPGAPDGDYDLYLKQSAFPDAIANGIPARAAAAMAVAQRPVTLSALTAESGAPAWKSLPSFYLLGTQDHIVPVALQSAMAKNAGAKITRVKAGHLPMITNPHAVEALIVEADRSTPTR
ncbi:Pimeloyl-ACP methyl ester carboxylesterase [Streptosporangium subroseum]|uniref:Pimeloyl-ACP methyl ester carboxylesterase n=1 Tax=Streptosporangium subroseum TaxID=106412 RepID=A0A239MTW5_9ACTN|nr:alpha/beta hydrolase [Streptosporangium subroseum]SNT45592.1 Pimeloyl-ACP methyl ester carboxylesterase [Streptosporangium subroseum]